MRLRTFIAADMPAAMKMVRQALGDGAIILSSETSPGGGSIAVTAAVEYEDEAPSPATASAAHRDETLTGELRFELQNILRFHNLPELFIAKLMQRATDANLNSVLSLHRVSGHHGSRNLYRLAIEKLAGDYFSFAPLQPDKHDRRIMLVGAPGIGKTLTLAKIAARLALEKLTPLVVTTDNKRAGGVEQLQAFTSILGLELRTVSTRAELAKVIQSQPAQSRLLIDTAGCNPYDHADLHELKSYANEGIEPVLVMQAGGDSLEAIDAVEAFCTLPIKRMLVTRADTSRRLGGVLAAAAAHGLGFCNVSSSSSIADALQPLDSALLAQLLLRYQLQTS